MKWNDCDERGCGNPHSTRIFGIFWCLLCVAIVAIAMINVHKDFSGNSKVSIEEKRNDENKKFDQ